jgi:hypothetical protein
VLKGEHAMFSA